MAPVQKPRKKSLWKRTLLGLCLILAVLVIYHLASSWFYDRQLGRLIDQIAADDPDWQWESQLKAREALPLKENGAHELVELLKLTTLRETIPSINRNAWAKAYYQLYQDNTITIEPYESFLLMHPNARLPDAMREKMQPVMEMQPMPEVLPRARKLRDIQSGRYDHTIRPLLILSLLPDVQGARGISNLLSWHGDLLAWKSQWPLCIEVVQAMLGVARTFSHDPFLISQLVRMAVAGQACRQTMKLLAQHANWTDAQLQTLEAEIRREYDQSADLLQLMMKCERAVLDHDLLALINKKITYHELAKTLGRRMELETGMLKLDQVLSEMFPELVLGWGNRPRHLNQERYDLLVFCNHAIGWSRLPEHELMGAIETWKQSGPRFSPFLRSFYHMSLMFGAGGDDIPEIMQLRSLARGFLGHRARLRCCLTMLACERYRLEQGSWPANLQSLSPKFLKNPLIDPYTGQALLLKPLPDGLVIYSPGDNRLDDGGDVLMTEQTQPKDIGYRLWHPAQRGINLDAMCAVYVESRKEVK